MLWWHWWRCVASCLIILHFQRLFLVLRNSSERRTAHISKGCNLPLQTDLLEKMKVLMAQQIQIHPSRHTVRVYHRWWSPQLQLPLLPCCFDCRTAKQLGSPNRQVIQDLCVFLLCPALAILSDIPNGLLICDLFAGTHSSYATNTTVDQS